MKSNTVWALLTGLAVGFLIGQYTERGRNADTPRPAAMGPTTIPSDWVTEKDLHAEDKFAGLTPQQRFLALKVLNEKPCDCGCPHGSVAKCAKEDPGCPRAPSIIAGAVAAARDGKSYDQIMAAVKKPERPQPQEQAGPQKVELAAWTPVRGPKHAKVTIIEFSDFQ
jgi:hypothetical protein